MPLKSERRFARSYESGPDKRWAYIPRFADGSASMTFDELSRDWLSWSERDRGDFCHSCSFLSKQDDYLPMLRFVMRNGSSSNWGSIAAGVALHLPADEASELLSTALSSTKDWIDAANITCALSSIKSAGDPGASTP